MKRLIITGTAILLVAIACKTVPFTGRKQFNFMNPSEVNAMSFTQYKTVLSESKLSTNKQQSQMVKNVGERIKNAVNKYMNDNGYSNLISGFEWEFNLIDDPTVNAWCMPGGKVAFYTGIMPICQDETGVAVVMGHEVAHAIAQHGAERMSHEMSTQLGGAALSVALQNQPELTQSIAMSAFGLGAQYGAILPFSRSHESEADKMGLMFMAMAGYNPEEAPKFWERMSTGNANQIPEFLSTHPSHTTRITDLKANMPEAMKYYNAAEKAPLNSTNNNNSGFPRTFGK